MLVGGAAATMAGLLAAGGVVVVMGMMMLVVLGFGLMEAFGVTLGSLGAIITVGDALPVEYYSVR